ncbi:MAG: regulatory protein RecX [Ruminococcus sp.]|nr:regulatory protein RecX [Ruminococcus sp.]
MIITEIVPVTKQKYRIVTDEQLAFVLYKGELSHYHLHQDEEIREEVFREIMQTLTKRAKLRAMHLLTKKDYTVAELYKKLMDGEYTQDAVEEAVAYVKSYHYLDDERYVQNYIRYQSGKKSRRQIQFELERKGISRDIIERYQQDSEDEKMNEIELIRSLLEKRCKSPKAADEKEKSKHYMYLARKGFRSSDIMQVFHEFF